MEIKFTARHFDAKPSLREAALEAAKKLERFHNNIITAEIILSFEKMRDSVKVAEFVVRVHDHTLVVKEASDDFYKSIHDGTEKMVRQLGKLKTKLAAA
jgi:putative sigma-54 modulation protein